jgi:signal transduction histidine kinase
MALHVSTPGWSRETVSRNFQQSLQHQDAATWWYDAGRLYWVFLRPISAGDDSRKIHLGFLAVGYQVDSSVAEQLARVAGSHIALANNNDVIASTLPPAVESQLQQAIHNDGGSLDHEPQELALAEGHYEVASVLLQSSVPTPIRCFVLMPLARTNAFMDRLNKTILYLGFAAILVAGVIFTFIARAVTSPLDNLVAGVRALASGNYTYSISPRGSSEIAELAKSFANMRTRLLESQVQRIEAERISALGRTASSISHDLRHYLAAVVANAEFLYEMNANDSDRHEIYEEIKTASDQMVDLIDSLRELAREHGTVNSVEASLDLTIHRAIEAVHARPEFRNCEVLIRNSGEMDGCFDPKKLERVFFNLALNACEATNGSKGRVLFDLTSTKSHFDVRVSDEGTGIPPAIRTTLFDPFVSSGKPNGTGLGLAIVSKIVHDHGGEVSVERTSTAGTTILVHMPRYAVSTTAVTSTQAR